MKTLMLASLLTLSIAQAGTLVVREDYQDGREPKLAAGVILPKVEVWAFSQPDFPIYEVGRMERWQLGARSSVLAGGYISYWDRPQQLYLEPYSIWRTTIGTTILTAKLAAYMPLNGGAWQAYSDQMSITWPVGQNVTAGLTTRWWLMEGAKPSAGIGPMVTLKTGDLTWLARATFQNNRVTVVRLEAKLAF